MASSSLYFISITLLILISIVGSVYHAYTYDDGYGNEEHCCFVQTHGQFCMAKPITRSLVQVSEQCDSLDRPAHFRSHGKKRNPEYLNRIVRRLNVKSTYEFSDRILIELKTPLGERMLNNDLVCLKSSSNQKMDFEKCYIESIDESGGNDDNKDQHVSRKSRKSRPHYQHNHQKRYDNQTDEEMSIVIQHDKDSGKQEAKNERKKIPLNQPIRIREGRGFVMHQAYTSNMSHARATNRRQRKCYSWYRKVTQKLRRNPSKHRQICVRLQDHNEQCISQLIQHTVHINRASHRVQRQEQPRPNIKPNYSKESRLYCQNHAGNYKLLGYYRSSVVCFHKGGRMLIEHEFNDISGLSNMNKNKDILQFIAKDDKLTAELNNDCNDETTLVEAADLERKITN